MALNSEIERHQQCPCLAITLIGPKPKNGRRVFDSFLEANKACFWNRELVQAMEAAIYMGFMRPGTLFISAPAGHLQTIRGAWARRVLKPALGYQIDSLGDLGAIQTVQQTHFVPLGDVLCDAIAYLNRNGQPATLPSIRDHISRTCAQVASPTLEMLRQTANSLAATGLVYQMGEHFFVSVPAQVATKEIECQTGESIIVIPDKGNLKQKTQEKKRQGILSRLFRRTENKRQQDQKVESAAFAVPSVPKEDWVCGTRLMPAPSPPKIPQSTIPPHPPHPVIKLDCLANELQRHLETHYLNQAATDRRRKTANRRAERRQKAPSSSQSSSECLNYGPIDPPECLPRNAELVEDTRKRRRNPQRRESQFRASTPIIHSDSAYSPSPTTTENEENHQPNIGKIQQKGWSDEGCHRSGGSEGDVTHTYVNLHRMSLGVPLAKGEDLDEENPHESTQFEEFTLTSSLPLPSPQPPQPPRRYINLISNL